MEFDAVIVGAGHNGLAAAAHLASKGWSVGVFEGANVAGGAVKTQELTLPGFRHDRGAMNLSLFAGSAFFRAYENKLREHGLDFAPVSDCFASAFPDKTWLGVSNDLDTTCARIAAYSEEDAHTWREMAASFADDAPHLFALLGNPMSKRNLAKTAWSAWRAKGGEWLMDTVRLLLSSPREFLDTRFRNDRLKTALSCWGMHLDFPPDASGGALFPYLEGMANQAFGMVIGKGGADTMIKAMGGMIVEAGGEIHLGRSVERIEVASGTASAVRLADGETVGAKRAVIAGVAPRNLVDGLLAGSSGNTRFDERMRSFRHAPGTMMIHLAMDGLPDWKSGKELKNFAYVHLAPSMTDMARTYSQAEAGLLPDEPVLVVGQPTAIDTSRAPDGKHILWVQTRVVPAEIAGDAAGKIKSRDWRKVADSYADRAMAIIDRYAPGTSKKVLARTVHSPLDLENDNPNLVGGDQICGSHHLAQNFLFRPAAGWAGWKTPVNKLYLTGAATWPGAGTGAGSGYMLARQLAGA